MPQPDLDAIDPERRAETARRIAVIERYLAIEMPDGGDDAAHAQEIGVGVGQLLRLVRIWRDHRRPELLSGAGARRGSANMRGRSRARPGPHGVLIVDEVALDLPVRTRRPRALPILHLLLDAGSADLLAWRLDEDRIDEASAASMMLALPGSGRTVREASLPAELAEGELGRALAASGVDVATRARSGRIGEEARRLLGPKLAGISLRSRAVLRGDARARVQAAAIDLKDAIDLLRWRLGTPALAPHAAMRLPAGASGARLRSSLQAIAGGLR